MRKYTRTKNANFGFKNIMGRGVNAAKVVGNKGLEILNAASVPIMFAPLVVPDATTRAHMKMQKKEEQKSRGKVSVGKASNNEILPTEMRYGSMS